MDLAAGTSARDVAADIAKRLAAAGVPSPAADARWLLEGIAGVDPHRTPERGVPDDRIGALGDAVTRRIAREPLQLIVGSTSFRGIEVACRPGVFVPRPETEVVAGVAIAAASARRQALAGETPPRLTVVDVCTGTGAIACCLAVEVAGCQVIATDLDPQAVSLAQDNLSRTRDGRAGVAGFARDSDAEVVNGHLLSGVDPSLRGHLDVLVSNPPYLPERDQDGWEPEVAHHDPSMALIGGVDGHELVDELLHLAMEWLAPGGTVVVEIDERRGVRAADVAREVGLVDVEVVDDLTGVARCVVGRRAG